MKNFKLLFSLALVAMLYGCASAPTKKPLIQFGQADQTLAIINVFPKEVSYSRFSAPIWRSKQRYVLDQGLDIEETFNEFAIKAFTNFGADNPRVLPTTQAQKKAWNFAKNESLAAYVKRISSDQEVFDLAASENLQQAILLVPAKNFPANGVVGAPSAGLRYYESLGTIEPHAAVRIFVLDVPTRTLLGSHYISSAHKEIKIKNTLSQSEKEKIEKKYKEEIADRSGSGAHSDSALGILKLACADYDRIDSYSEENKAIGHAGIVKAIDRVFAILANIYIGSDVPSYKSWRSGLSLTPTYSCEDVS